MRLFPIVLTVVITGVLLAWVLQRDRFYAQLGITSEPATESVEVSETPAVEPSPESVAQSNLIKVVAYHSVAERIDTGIVLRGQTEAFRQVDVRSQTTSTVVSTPLRKGMFIEEGQEMCVLDAGTRGASLAEARARLNEAQARKAEAEARIPETRTRVPEAAARLAEAEARLEEALTNENAAVKLAEDGFAADTRVKGARATVAAARASVAAADAGVEGARSGMSATLAGIESAQAGIESAEAGVAAAQKEIERLVIKAPFSGLLESDTAELGTLLQPGTSCATIIQLDPIKLVAFVPETEVNRVQVGALAGARLASSADLKVSGNVTFLSRSADPTTRTFRVEIEIPNTDLAIRDGQTAEILIQADGETAHLLPASSMTLNDEGTLGVRTVDADGMVNFVAVQLVRDTPEGVWLTGLPDQVDVITVGQEYVTEGVQVAPTFKGTKS